MSKKIKIFVGILCIFCAVFSFLYYINKNRFTLEGLLATINVNVEINKNYINDLYVVTEPHKDIIIQLTPTGSLENDLKTTIIHAELIKQYAQGISIRVPAAVNQNVISSIDSISVFIGNKLFYFYSTDIATWNYKVNDDGDGGVSTVDYVIPVGVYKKSIIKPWINWYGDLNFLLIEILQLITKPHKFLFVYFFFLIFIVLFIKEIKIILKKYNKQAEIILLFLLITFAFLIRVDSMTRYSAWNDEIISVIHSNPKNSLKEIINDPGTPPLYYFLLRLWFTITGWSEVSGRLLSVIIGTGGILTLYIFIKSLCGKKSAFISAFLLAISYSSLGYSNEMRAYILLIMLCPLVSYAFINLLKYENNKSKCLFIIFCILLVNTHYYGVLFIAGIFFYYFILNKYTLDRMILFFTNNKYAIEKRKILNFIFINFIIALSFIPYFIFTTFNNALVNESFHTWSTGPGKKEFIYGIIALLIYKLIKVITSLIKRNKFYDKNKILLLNYASWSIIFIYFAGVVISITYRNIFLWRYISICLPLVIAILSILFSFISEIKIFKYFYNYSYISKIIISFILLTYFSNFINNWRILGNGNEGSHKESQEYILKDSINYKSTAEIIFWRKDRYRKINEFYGGPPTTEYINQNLNYDYIYINPENNMPHINEILSNYNIDENNLLKIRFRRGKKTPVYIYKIKNTIRTDEKYNSIPNGNHVGEITENTVIKQIFLSNDNNLCAIQIIFATFARTNSSSINLQLYDENDTLLNEETIQSRTMLDNSYLRYKFADINDSIGKKYTLVIYSKDAVPGNAVTIWCTNGDSYDGNLFINDQQQSDNLCIILEYSKF